MGRNTGNVVHHFLHTVLFERRIESESIVATVINATRSGCYYRKSDARPAFIRCVSHETNSDAGRAFKFLAAKVVHYDGVHSTTHRQVGNCSPGPCTPARTRTWRILSYTSQVYPPIGVLSTCTRENKTRRAVPGVCAHVLEVAVRKINVTQDDMGQNERK